MPEDYQETNSTDKRKRSKAHMKPVHGYSDGSSHDKRPMEPYADTTISVAYETDRIRIEHWNDHRGKDIWIAWDKETGESILEGRWVDESGDHQNRVIASAQGHDTEAVLRALAKAHDIPLHKVYSRPPRMFKADRTFLCRIKEQCERRRAGVAAQ